MTASQLLKLYHAGALSPVEATKAALAGIERNNGVLKAFNLISGETALAAARESEERWRLGAPRGLLDGVPVSVKDLLLTKGWPTLRGSKAITREQAWDEDAPAVARLRGTAPCCWARPPRRSSAGKGSPIRRSTASPAIPGTLP